MPVIDASIAIAYLFPDEDGQTFDRLRQQYPNELFAPTFLDLELLNTIILATRRNRFDEGLSAGLLQSARMMPIRRIEPDTQTMTELVGIAERRGLTAYDALYLALAKNLGRPLATADRRLRAAAEAEGLTVLP